MEMFRKRCLPNRYAALPTLSKCPHYQECHLIILNRFKIGLLGKRWDADCKTNLVCVFFTRKTYALLLFQVSYLRKKPNRCPRYCRF